MYRPGLQRKIASWGFTLSTNVDRWNLDVGEEKLQKSFTGKKRRNLRHRSDPSFLDGWTCSGHHGYTSITTARQRWVAHTMEEIICPKPCLSPMHEQPRMSLLANYAALQTSRPGRASKSDCTFNTRQPIWFLVCVFRLLNCATFDKSQKHPKSIFQHG